LKDFGYEPLISILLPGSILFASAWLLVDRFLPGTAMGAFFSTVSASEWQFGVVILFGSALLGTLLSSLTDLLEWKRLDARTAKRLDIEQDLYDEEWYCYVESLKGDTNSYLTRKAVFYYFEMRAGIALIVLAAAWATRLETRTPKIAFGVACLVCAGVLLFLSSETHHLLGWWRHRLYEVQATENLKRKVADDADREDPATADQEAEEEGG